MLLEASPNLDDMLVSLLAQKPALNASKIKNDLDSQDKKFSIQAIYKALGVLETNGVVVKERQKYSLRLPWVIDLKNLTATASLS